jgi:hypothetical protein
MLVIPVETESHAHDMLRIVLGPKNQGHMKQADRAQIKLAGGGDGGRNLVRPAIMLCYEEDQATFMRNVNRSDIKALLAYLGRGWQYRPDAGDHDRGPERIAPGQ